MSMLWEAFGSLFESLGLLFVTLWQLLAPWALLAVWVLLWLFVVDWRSLVATLKQGTWAAVLLLGFATVLIWGSLQPVPQTVFGYELQNFVGKAVVVALLYALAIGSGAIQLAWLRHGAAA